MSAKTVLSAVTLYAGFLLAGLLDAILITLMFAGVNDPYGSGTSGDGILYMLIFQAALGVGWAFAIMRAGDCWNARRF